MVAPLTPKPTRKAKALAKAPPTIASRREEEFMKNSFFSFFYFLIFPSPFLTLQSKSERNYDACRAKDSQ
jgi:hypothetical protein